VFLFRTLNLNNLGIKCKHYFPERALRQIKKTKKAGFLTSAILYENKV